MYKRQVLAGAREEAKRTLDEARARAEAIGAEAETRAGAIGSQAWTSVANSIFEDAPARLDCAG